ncbi:FG-GAP-like repeat-containing protein [Micromonospora sp. NBC_01699]|uniref:FG-GAP repeat domain-containing protein n=1 Tax=Micromonospora sp. NBC_01699 TaxID=2975984 RepID=UPI002E2AA1A9|nr:VCBS repeat-containing protein [Micromonospora sp. NBC_01699]
MWGKRVAVVAVVATMAALGAVTPDAWAGGPGEPMFGDLNRDGLVDLATLDSAPSPDRAPLLDCTVSVRLGKSGGGYQAPTEYPYLTLSGPEANCPDLGVAVDLGGDSDIELVLAWFAGRPYPVEHDLLVLKNFKPTNGFDAIFQPSFMGLADFNGDGRQDVYQWTDQGSGFATYLNTPDGGLTPGPVAWCSGRPQYSLADFNGNGAMDVVIAYVEGCADYFSGVVAIRDDGVAWHLQGDPYGDHTWTVKVQQADDDRILDVVTRDSFTGELTYFIGNGDGSFIKTPKAVADRADVSRVKKTSIPVLTNDAATKQAKITIVTAPRYGKVTVTSNRTVVFTPSSKPGKTDRFVYRLTDHGRSSDTTVSVRITS